MLRFGVAVELLPGMQFVQPLTERLAAGKTDILSEPQRCHDVIQHLHITLGVSRRTGDLKTAQLREPSCSVQNLKNRTD